MRVRARVAAMGSILAVATSVVAATLHPHTDLHAQGTPQQQASPLESVALSEDSVEIGDRFDLRLRLRLGPADVAFFPDSLAAPGVEPFDAVEWSAETGAGGTRLLTISYPLLAYQTGPVLVPDFDVFLAPRTEAVEADYADSEDLVGSWDAFRAAPARVPTVRLLPVPPRQVMVATVLGLDDNTTQITPRPPADLSGGNRDWLSTVMLAVFGVLLTGIAVSSTRDWMRYRAMVPPPPPPTPREQALTVLTELEASGMHADGRLKEFYTGWSEAIRRYIESFQTAWGPAWTSTELMSDLQGRRRSVAVARAMGPEEIAGVMRTAEEVKFGGLRPNPETALGHLRQAREWVQRSAEGEAPVGPASNGAGS